MSKLLDIARSHKNAVARITDHTVRRIGRFWVDMSVADLWQPGIDDYLAEVVAEGQRAVADEAEDYLREITTLQPEFYQDSDAFVDDDLSSLMSLALDEARDEDDHETGLLLASEMSQTYAGDRVSEAAKQADSVAIANRPDVTRYARVLELPSCANCVLLAGRVYRALQPFQRHPHCECRHVPLVGNDQVPDDATIDMANAVRAGNVTGLSEAKRNAILSGADPGQVINAKRDINRGKASRGRLSPEEIYSRAGENRPEALRLLRQHNYLI